MSPLSLARSSLLLFYTDGQTERRDGDGTEYDDERLWSALVRWPECPASQIAERILRDTDEFWGVSRRRA